MGQSGSTDRRNSLTKAHQFLQRDSSEWGVMEGFTFDGHYVGYHTLSKPATGVGALQQPIKDLYIKARKQGAVRKVMLRLVQSGMAISLVDTGGGQKGEMFYDASSISLIESFRFAVLSGNDKKVRAMFVPLAEQTMPSPKDKNAFAVDKNLHFLTQMNHPPILACVLRRPKGIKALDCHIFLLENVDDAFKIVSIIRQIQARGANPDFMGDVKQNDSGSFKRGQNNDVIRTEYGEYSVYRGPKQYELSDEFFRPGEQDMMEGDPGSPPVEDHNRGWSYEREPPSDGRAWNFDRQYSGEERGYHGDMRQGPPPGRGDPYYGDQGPRDREFVAHGRQRSSDSGEGRMNMSFSDSSDRGGRYEDSRGERGSFHEQQRGNISPRTSNPPRVAEKPHKPDPLMRGMPQTSPGQYSPTRPLSPRDGLRSPQYPTGSGYNQSPSAGRNYQPSSPGAGGPTYSLSNLESRQPTRADSQEDEGQSKPVAKVPPHLVAGVKVLPSNLDFTAIKLKPKSKLDRSYGSEEENDPDYDNNVNVLKNYRKQSDEYRNFQAENIEEKRNSYNNDRGYSDYNKGGQYGGYGDQGKGDHYGRGDNYGMGDGYGGGSAQGRGLGYPPDYGREYPDENRQYIEQYDSGVQRRGSDNRQQDSRGGQNRYSAPTSVYDDRSRDQGNRWSGSSGGGQGRSQSNYDIGSRGPPGGENGINPDGKELEIASMFSNFHIQKGDHSYNTGGNDFEQTLGYLP